MLWNLYSLPGYGREVLLAEPVIYEAASLLIDTWTIEQHHEEKSKYRYAELPREGKGPLSNYTGGTPPFQFLPWPFSQAPPALPCPVVACRCLTSWFACLLVCLRRPALPCLNNPRHCGPAGMSWSGFRPSDDPQMYGYNVPVNMYAQAAVERALQLNAAIWHSKSFEERAGALARTMREGEGLLEPGCLWPALVLWTGAMDWTIGAQLC